MKRAQGRLRRRGKTQALGIALRAEGLFSGELASYIFLETPIRNYYGKRGPKFLLSISKRDYAGNFPLWLAPEQVRILPIGDEPALLEYARSIQSELRAHQVRAELDASSDHMKTKIANAEQMKVHTMLVIGNRDMEANAVSLRVHGQGNLGAKPRDEVVASIYNQINTRAA